MTSPESSSKKIDEIFSLLKDNKVNEAIEYVNEGKLAANIDCTDEHGTTVLQYAAFRGHLDLCRLLVEKGADVNAKTHDQGYSALMFASVSNHAAVVRFLLEHDADTDYTNTIGRTASQMATFVNSHECADIINSYISKQSLEYYTEIHSVEETEPKLPKGECLNELHKLLTNSNNYSPVRILKLIKFASNNVLMLNVDKVIRTLEAFLKKAFRSEETECPNDLLSFKLHYYKYLFEYLRSQRKVLEKKYDQKELYDKLFDLCIKQFIKEEEIEVKTNDEKNAKISFRLFEEKFLRESIRQYPYKECALVRQMVTILAKTSPGSNPTALYVIKSCLNGQRFSESFNLDDSSADGEPKRKLLECATCTFKSYEAKWCTHCRQVAYCDQFCQRLHWPIHKLLNLPPTESK